MSGKPTIVVKDLYKSFKLPHEQRSGIKQSIIGLFDGKRGYETQEVLKDISFEIQKGDFFGIVGQNGSGKSTLLKLLAGIYAPDKGVVQVNGSLTPFIELGVGFNPELTGRENVYMNGALLGLNNAEVDAIYDDIVAFAELEKFMDQKLKNYSSGMQVRLAFSIAMRAESDILLFDEVLAVGDAAFQQKCYETFSDMKEAGRTIILVTHDMSAVQRFCEKAILIDGGEIVLSGSPSEVADRYLEQNFEESVGADAAGDDIASYSIEGVKLTSGGKEKPSFGVNEEFQVEFSVTSERPSEPIHIGFQIFSTDGAYVFGTNSLNAGLDPMTGKDINVKIDVSQNLGPGVYFVTLAVMNKRATKVLRYQPKMATFTVKQETKMQGIAMIGNEWSVTAK